MKTNCLIGIYGEGLPKFSIWHNFSFWFMYPIPKNWGKKSLVVVIAVSFYPSSTNMDLYTALSSLQTRLKGFTFFYLFILS